MPFKCNLQRYTSATACVPTLAISDIPKEAKDIPCDVSTLGATQLLTHDLFTNGGAVHVEFSGPIA